LPISAGSELRQEPSASTKAANARSVTNRLLMFTSLIIPEAINYGFHYYV
jgi:hypothetical protein